MMKVFRLSKKVGKKMLISLSIAFLLLINPALAQNSNAPLAQAIQLAQKDSAKEHEELEKATKEAQEAIDAAGKAAKVEIEKAIQEAEERLNQTAVVLEERANWGWIGLHGLLGLFGLAGKGKGKHNQ